MKILITSLLILLTIGCTSVPPPEPCHEKNGNECFASTITGVSYPIDVYLPPDYDSTDIEYPVIYVTDGEWYFASFSMDISRKQLPAIIVAIGNTDGQPLGRRAIDYLPPGSSDYYQFLSTELLPYIESKYRIATENRSVFGHSYGGRLVADILFMEPPSSPLFHNYISADPSLWSHTEELIELANKRYAITPKITGRLLITEATGTDGSTGSANGFEENYKKIGFNGLEITKRFYDTNHRGAALLSFSDAADMIFSKEKAEADKRKKMAMEKSKAERKKRMEKRRKKLALLKEMEEQEASTL